MNVRNLFTDDDAVSPVIGVILMVAITVILAAVIGAFVLNIGGSQESAPQATIDFTNTSEGVEIAHQSGDPLPGSDVNVKATGSNIPDIDTSISGIGFGDKMTAGDSFGIDDTGVVSSSNLGNNGPVDSGTEIQLIWNSPSSDDTSVIASYTTS